MPALLVSIALLIAPLIRFDKNDIKVLSGLSLSRITSQFILLAAAIKP